MKQTNKQILQDVLSAAEVASVCDYQQAWFLKVTCDQSFIFLFVVALVRIFLTGNYITQLKS